MSRLTFVSRRTPLHHHRQIHISDMPIRVTMHVEMRAQVRRTVRGTHYIVVPSRDVRYIEQEQKQPLKGRMVRVELEV